MERVFVRQHLKFERISVGVLQCNSAKNVFLHKVIAFCDLKCMYKCHNGANLPGPPMVGT